MSNAIATVPLLREWIEETCANMWSSAPRIVEAMEKWPGSEEPDQYVNLGYKVYMSCSSV
jgi:hypothetical protein